MKDIRFGDSTLHVKSTMVCLGGESSIRLIQMPKTSLSLATTDLFFWAYNVKLNYNNYFIKHMVGFSGPTLTTHLASFQLITKQLINETETLIFNYLIIIQLLTLKNNTT